MKVQFSCSVLSDSATPMTAACPAPLSITNSWSLLKLMFIEPVMPSNHLILCCPLLLPPSVFPSVRVFSNESVFHIRQPKYWCFSFSISPSNEYLGLISFRMDWLDLFAVQGTLKSLLQHHSSNQFLILKLTTLEERETKGPEDTGLSLYFPQNFVVYEVPFTDKMLRTNNSSEAFTTQYKAWLQTFILVLGN